MKNIITFDDVKIKNMLPQRKPFSNKGDFGRVLIIAGSREMCGCCVLAALGALRSGAGIVQLAFPEDLYIPVLSQLTECVFVPLKSTDGHIDANEIPKILYNCENADTVMFGCGVGTSDDLVKITEALVKLNKTPLVIDADGINCLSRNIGILKEKSCEILLTPHPKELSRLIFTSVKDIENNRQRVIEELSEEYNISVLLKGHETLVTSYYSDYVYKNTTGNTGLSKGGAGDLLSGIISALCVNLGGDLYKSACIGAYIHGKCADVLRDTYSEIAMLPSDCALALPQVYSQILSVGD